ncbi:hypothetical protein GCM10010182_80920 [Actinomadura cremea]|nr:hypothetical protein GCM10010182_80920 [Actinomadura cremea]
MSPIPAVPANPNGSTIYLDWVKAANPAALPLAEDAFATLRRRHGLSLDKPGRYLDEMRAEARRLPAAHRPWFLDTVGHRLLDPSPRYAGTAYAAARDAERTDGLPVDPGYRLANARLFAAAGALGAAPVRDHRAWLAATFPADRAHREFAAFAEGWGYGGSPPPANLHALVRASAKAAGLGFEADAEVLGRAIAGARGTALPDGLLDGAAKVFAQAPPPDEIRAALAELFPPAATDGGAWLRMLDAGGIVDAMASGDVRPEGGLAGWLGRFARRYKHVKVPYGGVCAQPMPAELYAALPKLAPRLKAEGTPVELHADVYRYSYFDADLLDACLAEGVRVRDAPAKLQLWGGRSRRDLRALAADPVFGKRLEGTVHADLRHGTAITRLSAGPGVEPAVRERLDGLLERAAGAALGTAAGAIAELDGRLDPPTIAALDGIDGALDALDLAAPLARTLRAGVHAELHWPALDEAVAELGEDVRGVTSTWPVLTVYGRERAIAIDHRGRRGACGFALPPGVRVHSVHYVGGDFLVGWSTRRDTVADEACWASDPAAVFAPAEASGMAACRGLMVDALGFHFETADGGRFDGVRVLYPGGRDGIADGEQLTDGTRVWTLSRYGSPRGWTVFDPATGERSEPGAALPDFFTSARRPGGPDWDHSRLSLARLPAGVTDSPLGQDGTLAGYRVVGAFADRANPRPWTIEGADGRRATFPMRPGDGRPWGIVRMPAGGADLIATQVSWTAYAPMRFFDAADAALHWEGRAFPDAKSASGDDPQGRPMLPPPAFWHFLAPRHLGSSRALRQTDERAARALLRAAVPGASAGVRATLAVVLPGVTDPEIIGAVVATVHRAADVLGRRTDISGRVRTVCTGAAVRPAAEVRDPDLVVALLGLLPERWSPSPQAATLTAVAADGRFLAGEIDDATRLASPPGRPQDWPALLGSIDAAAWRLVAPSTPDADRAALAGLLRTWIGQPFARPGTWRRGRATGAALAGLPGTVLTGIVPSADGPVDPERTYRFAQRADAPEPDGATDVETVTTGDDASRLGRLLDMFERHGPLKFAEGAVAVFAGRTGVRRAVAALVLDGLPRRRNHGSDLSSNFEVHDRMLRGKPYSASKAVAEESEELSRKLGDAGRLRVLAAAIPSDPAGLWTGGGLTGAAERMAYAWLEFVDRRPPVDEKAAGQLETDLGLGTAMAAALADPGSSGIAAEDLCCVVAARARSGDAHALEVYPLRADGSADRYRLFRDPYTAVASALVWALTDRPVGDPATAGAADLYARLRARMAAPELLLPTRKPHSLRRGAPDAFGPRTVPVRRTNDTGPLDEIDPDVTAYDDGLLIVRANRGIQWPIVRPSALADPSVLDRLERICAEHDLPGVLREVRGIALRYDGGIARMVARAADTPVPPGGYEANPLLGVPELVAEAAARTGAGEDAAALYLQLLTLARPTDRNVRRWNGWTAARHKRAQAELVRLGLVVEEKRARAGRTAFVPGEWTEVKAPELPLETAKLAPHLADVPYRKEVDGPFLRLLPTAPLHEMFAAAWSSRPL